MQEVGGGAQKGRENENEEETSMHKNKETASNQRNHATPRHHSKHSKRCNLADVCSLDSGDGWTLFDATRAAKTGVSTRVETHKRDDPPGTVADEHVSGPGIVLGPFLPCPFSVSPCADRCVFDAVSE